MGGRLITPRSANKLTDLADGAVAVRAHGRQARQNAWKDASVRPSPEHPAIPCAACSRCRRRARNRARFSVYLVLVAFASNSAAPACDRAAAPCSHSPDLFLPTLPGSALRPEARQRFTVLAFSGAMSPGLYVFANLLNVPSNWPCTQQQHAKWAQLWLSRRRMANLTSLSRPRHHDGRRRALARRHSAQPPRLPLGARRGAPVCVGLLLRSSLFAHENARLKLARLALATGSGHRTHAARRLNRAQRARRGAGFFLCHSFGARGAAPKKRSEIAGSVACRCGSSLLAEAAPRWNSRMDSRAPRIQPNVSREGRIAARLARVMYRYRDCHQIERMAIHSPPRTSDERP